MISVGIDVSKGKSMVCITNEHGEILNKPFEVKHLEKDLNELAVILLKFDDIRILVEATGIYHLPLVTYPRKKDLFVSVINPYEMKQYRYQGLRRVKTDKQDAIAISNFGIAHWAHLKNFEIASSTYGELKLLSRRYAHYMKLRIESLLELTHVLDYTMPGIKDLLSGWHESNGKDKLSDFVEEYWHYDTITKKSEKQFITSYLKWSKKKGYPLNHEKAHNIYSLAKEGISTMPSSTPSTKMFIQEAVKVLREVDNTLMKILTRMKELSKTLPEYPVVRAMGGVGDVLAPKLIAEIGNTQRFNNGKSLIAYAGIDAPPYQSDNFIGTKRKISKRRSSSLRKIGYETMRSLKSHCVPADDSVYNFIIKKEQEGKAKKVAKIAELNKFMRIYYARVMEIYR